MSDGSSGARAFRNANATRRAAGNRTNTKALELQLNRPRACRVWPVRSAFAALLLILFADDALCQTAQTVPPPSDFKKLSLDELQQLEVTSVSRRPEKISEAASAIQVITADDIRRAGATSLPEALRLAANLEVARVDSRQWAITARGFNQSSANKLLVLIDGRVVYSPLHAAVFWDVQDVLLEDIDRIEVISGPGTTLWGANAVNGVINITTKRAQDSQGLLVSAGGGSELRGAGAMQYGGTVGAGVQFRVYGKFFDRDNGVASGGSPATDAWNMGRGGFRVDWDASGADRFTVQGDTYDGGIAQPGASHVAVSGRNVIGRWSRTVSADSDFSLQMYYDHTHRNIPSAFSEDGPSTFAEDVDLFDVDFQHRVRLVGRHNVVWGLGYRLGRDDVGNSPVLAFLPAQVTQHWSSGFVQDEVPLATDRLRLTFGTKVERNDYTGVEFEPGGRLGWTLTDRHLLWGAISRAVRVPSRIDREFFVPGSAPFLLGGGPDFGSETLVAYELGYRGEPSDRLAVTVAAFYNDYDHLRSLEQVNPPAPLPSVFGNGQTGSSYGAELTAEYRIRDWWRLRSGYTELQVQIRPKPGSTDATFGSSEAHDAKHQGFVRQSFDFPHRVQVDVGLRGVSEIANQSVPAYGEMDVRVGWQATRALEWSIAGQNLLHDHHPEFGAPTTRKEAERGVIGTLAWRF